jgi:3-methylcrotonyl-CoA carboxylase alpha subunit/geranyl-CoA carboxylase alpha subunit
VLRFREPAGVRVDHALFEGLEVPTYYDSMLGKLVAHAATREQAIAQLAAALDRTEVLGLPTNRAFLAACLRHPDFAAGRALIPFLAQQGDALRDGLHKAERDALGVCGLAAVFPPPADAAQERALLPCPYPRPVRLRHRGTLVDVPVQGVPALPRNASAARVDGLQWHVQYNGVDFFVDDASFEPAAGAGGSAAGNELRAPFNGKVIAVKVVAGVEVRKGDALVILESMKLEHSLAASRDGLVKSVHVEPGQQAATGHVLVSLEPAPA